MDTEPTDDDVTRVDRRHDAATEFAYPPYSEAHDVELPHRASTRRGAAITAQSGCDRGRVAGGVVFTDTAMSAWAQRRVGQRSDEAGLTAREQIEKAAANHGWEATIEGRWLDEFRKGDHTVVAYWRPDGTVKDVTHFRGDIGLAYLAPTDGIVDWTVGRLAGRR